MVANHKSIHLFGINDVFFSVHFRQSFQEYIFYPAPKITVALLRGSIADEAGNISFERAAWLEAFLILLPMVGIFLWYHSRFI